MERNIKDTTTSTRLKALTIRHNIHLVYVCVRKRNQLLKRKKSLRDEILKRNLKRKCKTLFKSRHNQRVKNRTKYHSFFYQVQKHTILINELGEGVR